MNNAVMFGKATDEWGTPQSVFSVLDSEFHFEVDAAATWENRLCARWFGPGREYPLNDALLIAWNFHLLMSDRAGSGAVFLNPPYSKCRAFIQKAAEEARLGLTVVCLIPSRTDTRWWHDYIWDAGKHQPRPGVEIRFIKGRLKFGDSDNSAPFPSVVVVFRPCESARSVPVVAPKVDVHPSDECANS